MELNNPEQILHIYNEVLYQIPLHSDLDYHKIGDFKKQIACIYNMNEETPENKTLLTNLIHACKLTLEDVALISIPNSTFALKVLTDIKPNTCLLFGCTLANEIIDINKSLQSPFRFNNIKCLYTHPLSVLNENKLLKSQLWTNGLKPLFNL